MKSRIFNWKERQRKTEASHHYKRPKCVVLWLKIMALFLREDKYGCFASERGFER